MAAMPSQPVPPEVALWAFFEEHRRCGELEGGVEDDRLWMVCEWGAQMVRTATTRSAAPVFSSSAAKVDGSSEANTDAVDAARRDDPRYGYTSKPTCAGRR